MLKKAEKKNASLKKACKTKRFYWINGSGLAFFFHFWALKISRSLVFGETSLGKYTILIMDPIWNNFFNWSNKIHGKKMFSLNVVPAERGSSNSIIRS